MTISIDNRIYTVSSEDPEWYAMWSTFPDPDMYNPVWHESLQYMGTFRTTAGYVHEFRHRAIPGTHERHYWRIPASPQWQPRDVAWKQHIAQLER